MSDKYSKLSFLNQFANPGKWLPFFVKNATSDFLLIRPISNPLDVKGFEKMLSGNVVQEKAEISIIILLQFLSDNFVICILF